MFGGREFLLVRTRSRFGSEPPNSPECVARRAGPPGPLSFHFPPQRGRNWATKVERPCAASQSGMSERPQREAVKLLCYAQGYADLLYLALALIVKTPSKDVWSRRLVPFPGIARGPDWFVPTAAPHLRAHAARVSAYWTRLLGNWPILPCYCVIQPFGVATTQPRPECMMARTRPMLGKSSPTSDLNQALRSL